MNNIIYIVYKISKKKSIILIKLHIYYIYLIIEQEIRLFRSCFFKICAKVLIIYFCSHCSLRRRWRLSGSTPYLTFAIKGGAQNAPPFMVHPSGVEPESVASEATVLSIRLRMLFLFFILSLLRLFVNLLTLRF